LYFIYINIDKHQHFLIQCIKFFSSGGRYITPMTQSVPLLCGNITNRLSQVIICDMSYDKSNKEDNDRDGCWWCWRGV